MPRKRKILYEWPVLKEIVVRINEVIIRFKKTKLRKRNLFGMTIGEVSGLLDSKGLLKQIRQR